MSELSEGLRLELQRLEPLLGACASLDATRSRASLPWELAESLVEGSGEAERSRAFAQGLIEVVRAIVEDFPDNIFWDLDYLAGRLWLAGGPQETAHLAGRVVRLCRGFGNKSVLRFRYIHDFLFGYDWARWVLRQPDARANTGPFDLGFLDYLDARREELVELIARNDAKYGPLRGKEFRNPFIFCREPPDESQLHQVLAQADLIPVKAWRFDGERRWHLPFADLRAEAALRLGLARRDGP
ncbi:ferrochelatase [Stigmatella sp. ncwal1]|uniref:Ferrochelatase n=1 Tax=Stigmatella ashevillensis TaxID=2995309 RepID=A0ABT5DNB0_9BACT|nr:ferrochelatase [Stigmatella ashevillena]MDC0715132.1 ferrochelatase [Stigmatella ashevillena]